jgi:hypothetical protein
MNLDGILSVKGLIVSEYIKTLSGLDMKNFYNTVELVSIQRLIKMRKEAREMAVPKQVKHAEMMVLAKSIRVLRQK